MRRQPRLPSKSSAGVSRRLASLFPSAFAFAIVGATFQRERLRADSAEPSTSSAPLYSRAVLTILALAQMRQNTAPRRRDRATVDIPDSVNNPKALRRFTSDTTGFGSFDRAATIPALIDPFGPAP